MMDLEKELHQEVVARITSLSCHEVQQILKEAKQDLKLHYDEGLQLRGVLPPQLRNRLNHYAEHIVLVASKVAPIQQVVLEAPGLRSRSTSIGFDF